jgi:putative heme-binding domain-containing protein
VDNDPDSRPPNRLLDVVMHGDYGFKFRFGRSGLHPFQAWNGELPGTLPMMAGTGEGVCSILPCDRTCLPLDYRNAVLVTASWDHQIEVQRSKTFGASLRSDREVLVQGDESFRPVALAAGPDGSVYFSDWVNVSYNVHGQGRIWRLAAKPEFRGKPEPLLTQANASRQQMHRLLNAHTVQDLPDLFSALSDQDPFIRSAAVSSLSLPAFRHGVEQALDNKSPAVRLGALLALRRANVPDAANHLSRLLADPDEQLRLMAVVWTGEQGLTQLTNRLPLALTAGRVSPALLRAHAAAVKILSGATNTQTAALSGLGQVMFFDLTERLDEQPSVEILKAARTATPFQVRLEAVRNLSQTTNSSALSLLKQIAMDPKAETELRCDAILSLATTPSMTRLLLELLDDPSSPVRVEAARALRFRSGDVATREMIARKLAASTNDVLVREQLPFTLSSWSAAETANSTERPGSEEEWRKALAANGDASSGRRIFFQPGVGCAKCHRVEDHGGMLGPDLSTIARGADREKLMQSILNPSRDIAPQFVSHTIETRDGQVFSGVMIGESVETGVTLFMADGRAVLIPSGQIASHTQSKVSMMPEGLQQALTVQDFRDLLAFLLSRK